MDENLDKLAEQLRTVPTVRKTIRRVYIPKPGTPDQRPLGIPTVRDRVVQAAVRHVLEPIFERSSRITATDFVPDGAAKMPCDGSIRC